ncbi:MAG: hypothetical protein ACE5KA_09400 [Nitrososphaerales archaeon]
MEPSPHSFEKLLNSVHKEGVTLFDYDKMKIPCVFVKSKRFDEISKACYGKTLAVDASLNILHDDRKHVFVEMVLKFSALELEEKVLIYANENLEFFEHLAINGIIALASERASEKSTNIFMVQLPRKEIAESALESIKSHLK